MIHDADWNLGNYEVTYENGARALLPVRYGWNIHTDHATAKQAKEALGASLPFEQDGKTYYKTVFENPYPDQRIKGIEYRPTMEAKVELKSYRTFTVK